MNEVMPLHIPLEELAHFCRRYQVRELALLGSMLGQDHRPESDVDLLVSFQLAARACSALGVQSRFSPQGRTEAGHS